MITASRHSLRRLRLAAGAARWALLVLAALGIAATARLAVAPPRPIVRTLSAPREDHAVQAAAVALARAYLTLDGQRPDRTRAALATLTGGDAAAAIEPDAPPLVRQRVRWADVVSDRPLATARHAILVAADTDRSGLVHVLVTIERRPGGNLRIVGPPALVGGPILDDADPDPDARRAEVTDPALTAVCRRALENYLAGSSRNLAADLAATASVALPDMRLRLDTVGDLRWTVPRRSVAAAVEARDAGGVTYRLRYELDVVRVEDRWEIAALGIDPTS